MNARLAALVVLAAALPAFGQNHSVCPAFAADGSVLAWIDIADNNGAVCLSAEPFEKVSAKVALDANLLGNMREAIRQGTIGQRLAVCGDGSMVFVAGKGVAALTVNDGKLGKATMLKGIDGTFSFVAANEDGTAIALLLDGPTVSSDGRSSAPSFRSLLIAQKGDGGWKLGKPMTEQEAGHFASAVIFVGPDRVMYNHDKKNYIAKLGEKPAEVRFPGVSFRPQAATADGKTVMVTGRDITDEVGTDARDIYLLTDEDGAWSKPQMVLRDPAVENFDNVTMSSDGKVILYENAVGEEDEKTTQVLALKHTEGEWSAPMAMFASDKPAKLLGLAACKTKQVAYSLSMEGGGKSELFLRGDLDEETKAVSLSEQSAGMKAGQGETSRPATTPAE